jgi:Tol biopolymer transport system component
VTTGLDAKSIALSGDGRHLAYVEYTARANIWSLPVPGSTVDVSSARQLTTGDQVIESLTLTQDGAWLLYDSNLYGNSDIFRMPAGGGDAERLTDSPADEFAPTMAPDGATLAYHTWRTGTRDVAVKALDGDEELLTRTDAQESYPAFSPDGTAIAFYDQRSQGGVTAGIFLMRRSDSGEWGEPASLRAGTGWPRWTPRGLIVYTKDDTVELLSPEDGQYRVVYAPRPDSDDPRAASATSSGDGRTLYLKSHDELGRARLWSLPREGGRPRLLVRFDDPARPSIRADFAMGAGQFFFTIEERRSDIWIAEVGER